MSYIVMTDKIKILMNSTDKTAPLTGSALQNPDLNRVQLGALLRRKSPDTGASNRRTFWSSFMSNYVTSHANSNS